MNVNKNARGVDKRRLQTPPRKEFNWRSCLIESAIAVLAFNIIAGLLAWYFIRHVSH